MFPGKRPNIHSIAVKFRCSHTQLQKYVHRHQEPPWAQQTMLLPESMQRGKGRQCPLNM